MGGTSALAPGEVFAGYTIEQVLGVGGMGSVYLAADPRLPRRVALKLLHPELTRDDYVRSRFESEAENVARLDHPNIVGVHDRGREENQLWIAMQYIEGTNAGALIRGDGPVAPDRAVAIIGQTANALDYAHHEGVLHRDVKPDNILIEHDRPYRAGRVLLADFGIAKAFAETAHLTQTGMMVASLQYAAPEQFEGKQLDERTDVYALGCALFHLLTGQPPYPGTSLPELLRGHLMSPVPRASAVRSDLAPGWDAVFARALAKDRDDRFASCGALAASAADAIRATPAYAVPNPTVLAPTLLAPTGHAPWAPDLRQPQRSEWPSDRRPRVHAQSTVPLTGLKRPVGVAVDPAGNVYVADNGTGRVLALPADSTAQQTLSLTGKAKPAAIAVDSAGALYVAAKAFLSSGVAKFLGRSGERQDVPLIGIRDPTGLAVDAAGNLYVTDCNARRVVVLVAGSSNQQAVPFTGLYMPSGVAVDTAGNVYVTDSYNRSVSVLAVGSTSPRVLPFTGLKWPSGLAVDAVGNVYVADSDNKRVVMLPVGSNTQVVLPFRGLASPSGVAVDAQGTVYVADSNAGVLKLTAG